MDKTLAVVLEAIDKAKGMNTVVYRFTQLNPAIDYVVITSASNMRQVNALSDYVKEGLLENGCNYRHKEGTTESKWILVDADHVIVHIFEEAERDVYALEKLYGHLERVELA